jgi:hypothetical protein
VNQNVERRAKRFRRGTALLAVALVPWFAWVFWLGRNDPWNDPAAHHKWFMRLEAAFVTGVLFSLASLILLLFGKGWPRFLFSAMAACLLLFCLATALVGD